MSRHSQGVIAIPCSCRGGESRECLEVQPQLTDVVRDLAEGVGAGGGTGGCVAAGVARVPDVGDVGGDRGPTGGCRADAADTEASRTGATGRATPAGAFRGGVAGPSRGGVATAGALIIGKLDYVEQ